MLVATLAACKYTPTGINAPESEDSPTTPVRIDLSPDSVQFEELDSDLQLSVESEDGEPLSTDMFTFDSQNSKVATVSANGVVTGHRPGSTRIVASGLGSADTSRVVVRPMPASLSISPRRDTLSAIGATLELEVRAKDRNGKSFEPQHVEWESFETSVAAVDDSGRVTAVGMGTTQITARARGKTDTATIVVEQVPNSLRISPARDTLDALGERIELTANVSDANGETAENPSIEWASLEPDVVHVSTSGVVEAKTVGTGRVTATSGEVTDTATIVVRQVAADLTVSPSSDTLTAVGEQVDLTANVSDANGHPVDEATVAWSSNNPDVASVDSKGTVEAHGTGQAEVTATSGGLSDVATVVVQASVSDLNLSPSVDTIFTIGDSTLFQISPEDSEGEPVDCTDESWKSLDTSVAEIGSEPGVVIARALGTALITASACGVTDTATALVEDTTSTDTIETSSAVSAAPPELPRKFVETSYTPPGGRVISVRAGDNLQAAIDSARPGDILELEAGATFTGNFVLPEKSGDEWIVIRSAAPDSELPAEGQRITPGSSSVLPKLVTEQNKAALTAPARSHHYRIIGIEVTANTDVKVTDLVRFGDGGQTTVDEQAHHLILDRVYVHGQPSLELRRCVVLNGAHMAMIDSYLSECHHSGADAQAVLSWSSSGPLKIVNNYLAGSGENVMFGGADPAIEGLIPQDIEVRRNHFHKPPEWEGVWSVKNLLEFKIGKRTLVEGNVFENVWPDAQTGYAFVIKSTDQGGGGNCPFCVTEDVTIRGNKIINAAQGFSLNRFGSGKGDSETPTSRVRIENNLFVKFGKKSDFRDRGAVAFQIGRAPRDLAILHNTVIADRVVTLYGGEWDDTVFEFRDNIAGHGEGKFKIKSADGAGDGDDALNYHYGVGNWRMDHNVLIGLQSYENLHDMNFDPATVHDVGFASVADEDYRLLSSSPYKSKASDGKDPGADVEAIERATRDVVVSE